MLLGNSFVLSNHLVPKHTKANIGGLLVLFQR